VCSSDLPKDKGILLKEILESDVDDKYFLTGKMLEYLNRRKDNYNNGKINYKTENDIASCINASSGSIDISDNIIIHNTMPRSSTTGKGGTGQLSRTDGKTYCLDTGSTNAIEIREVKQLNPSLESGGKQPFQQNRVYDINGISPALQAQLPHGSNIINTKNIRRLTPIECERLQTVNDNYTNHVSDSQRYKMLGNGWTVDVIAHIFKYIKL
jgi:DNA (cytosine-5)-methyltransferase 3A